MSSSSIYRLRTLMSVMGLFIAFAVACNGVATSTPMPAVLPTDRADEVTVAVDAAVPTSLVQATPTLTATSVGRAIATESIASAPVTVESVASPSLTSTATAADSVATSVGVASTSIAASPEPTATAIPPPPRPTVTAVPPTATPLSMGTEVVPEPTSVADRLDVTASPDLDTPTAQPEPTVADATAESLAEVEATVADGTVQPTVVVDYFEGHVEPCESESNDIDPCEPGRALEFERGIPASIVLPDRPPSLEELLFNSWGGSDLDEVPNYDLTSAPHIVARGRFQEDSVVCEGYPVVNPGWSVDLADFDIPVPGPDENVFIDFGIFHWVCFARLQVHEYMVGKGGASVNVMLAAAGIPYYDEAEPDAPESHTPLELHRMAVSDHFVGPEWVVWLAPSYTAAVESWTAYSLWGVQRGDDGIVRVISPVADYYENFEGGEFDHSHLMAPLDEFRQLIADADSSRVERTSGRIGVGADTPMLVQDALRLSDYYKEIGASEFAMIPPTPHPTGQ